MIRLIKQLHVLKSYLVIKATPTQMHIHMHRELAENNCPYTAYVVCMYPRVFSRG